MSLSKGIQSAAAAALSAAMLIAVAACGTTDSTDTASKSGDSSKDSSSTSIQGFDTSSIQKDDEIAALLPDSVAGDGTLTVGTDTSYAPAEFLAEDGKTPVRVAVEYVERGFLEKRAGKQTHVVVKEFEEVTFLAHLQRCARFVHVVRGDGYIRIDQPIEIGSNRLESHVLFDFGEGKALVWVI